MATDGIDKIYKIKIVKPNRIKKGGGYTPKPPTLCQNTNAILTLLVIESNSFQSIHNHFHKNKF
jgi:hypothetical protein